MAGPLPVVLFHSVLGVRPGVLDAAERLRAAGHPVTVVDQYDGVVHDDYDEAGRFADAIGYPALMGSALAGVVGLPDDVVLIGWSNGGGMAEFVATQRPCAGVVLLAGALSLSWLGEGTTWPGGVPVQVHYTVGDPYREQDAIDGLVADARAAGARVDLFDYPGDGHLFSDPSLPREHDAVATELLWRRVLAFCEDPTRGPGSLPGSSA